MSAVFSLQGKSALVTGAGAENGIGFATAKALVELGAQVYLTGASDRVLQRAKASNATGFVFDLTDEDQSRALAEQIPQLDILVNNAGMTSFSNPAGAGEAQSISEMKLTDWHLGLARNLDTAFLITKQLLPKLRNSKQGRIIMVSSVTGAVMAMKNQPVYAAAKAAMVGLTKSIAIDEAQYGITCNAVLPGWIATDAISESEKTNGTNVPLARAGSAAEVAAAIAWLATAEASYITGQSIIVDGGNSIMEEKS